MKQMLAWSRESARSKCTSRPAARKSHADHAARKLLLTAVFCLACLAGKADEGMWMLNDLSPHVVDEMHRLGLQLSINQIYNPDSISLKDAVVSFGGFCTGVVVSPDGLLFTNHHCGFESIHQNSSSEHDYLQNGFVARSQAQELPAPDLFVSFLVRSEDVTERILQGMRRGGHRFGALSRRWKRTLEDIDGNKFQSLVDSLSEALCREATEQDSTLHAEVTSYFGGQKYFLTVYRDYNDVRLVCAPPASIGKFGGDTDNWVWPRQTGDFSVFRIYADSLGRPAPYSPSNKPLHLKSYAHISLKGYREGDFCMTLGYPGETKRYLSSYGIEERMYADNAAMIQVRGLKQSIWRRWMNNDSTVRLRYADKYALSSNYWKNSLGMNQSIERLHILDQKRATEARIEQWARLSHKRKMYRPILKELADNYAERRKVARACAFCEESFFNTGTMLDIAMDIVSLDKSPNNHDLPRQVNRIAAKYRDIDARVDREVLAALLRNYAKQMPDSQYLPSVYDTIRLAYKGDFQAYIDTLYKRSALTSTKWITDSIFNSDSQLMKDPAILLATELYTKVFLLGMERGDNEDIIRHNEELLAEAIRRQDQEAPAYSDANSTMRLSYGTIQSYTPEGGRRQPVFTTPADLMNKADTLHPDNDYAINRHLLDLFRPHDFGPYTDPRSGKLQLCFITNNDITGGNSGSPVFNAKGELIGLAFDGNWDAMSSDMAYNQALTRCISVDIRYVLYMIERWAKAKNLVDEIEMGRGYKP
jgi:hypothetical protein